MERFRQQNKLVKVPCIVETSSVDVEDVVCSVIFSEDVEMAIAVDDCSLVVVGDVKVIVFVVISVVENSRDMK